MLKLKPTRLRGRIGLILVLRAVLAIGLISVFIMMVDPRNTAPLYRLPDPEKVALIVTAFEHTPVDSHADLVRAFTDPTQLVFLVGALPAPGPSVANGNTAVRYHDALGGRPFRIQTFGADAPEDFNSRAAFSAHAVQVVVALPDGHALAIRHMAVPSIAKILEHQGGLLLSILMIDILVILWLASQTTRPVERLARAVREDQLGALIPRGPREIVELATTFKDLRAKLKALLQERTRMLAAIAHDYRTYLTRLELRSEFIDDPEQRALAASDLEEMRALLSDTLTFARESANDEAEDAASDLRDELRMIENERRARGETIAIMLPSGPVMAVVSHLSFQRMMANLLDNAVRYGGGKATVRGHIGDGRISILVEDEGPGVPEDSLERLVEPFERLEPSRARQTGGVGLGLSIVQALAHRYHGELTLENRREGGFRATLTLREVVSADRTR